MSEGATKKDMEFNMAEERDLVLAIGTFDDVHLGHRYLVQQVVRRAEERGWLSGAMIFHSHPRVVVTGIAKLGGPRGRELDSPAATVAVSNGPAVLAPVSMRRLHDQRIGNGRPKSTWNPILPAGSGGRKYRCWTFPMTCMGNR